LALKILRFLQKINCHKYQRLNEIYLPFGQRFGREDRNGKIALLPTNNSENSWEQFSSKGERIKEIISDLNDPLFQTETNKVKYIYFSCLLI
jgi:hypothetical protein